ncbi:B- and T-lymphocyte attenuator-like [Parambassis ranga]|uniref:B- and T-lymphocyte attenuator-like n=1 Tax=Parambassis ranga TaxID=210632 RepID=A0A6P7HKN1_9TELE|nr:B- and T-lymphocyte attenuator-like [Parambassis ranga]
MAGGAPSFLMGFNHCWIVLSILAVLLFTSNADSEECFLQIKVRRNTVYEASVGQELRINCTVAFCNSSPPAVTWIKLNKKNVPVNMSSDIKTEWKMLKDFEGVSYLTFQNIHKRNSGVYQCESDGDVSHYINISVYDGVLNGTLEKKNVTTNSSSPSDEGPENFLMYVYSAAGIISSVIIVIIISVVSLRGCKGKSNKEAGTENQYISIPMVEHPSLHTSPRGSPSVPPCRRSFQRQTPVRQPEEARLSRGREHSVRQAEEEDRGRQRTTAEEDGSSIVYAALNYQLRPAAQPRIVVEENSEYAAIRVA